MSYFDNSLDIKEVENLGGYEECGDNYILPATASDIPTNIKDSFMNFQESSKPQEKTKLPNETIKTNQEVRNHQESSPSHREPLIQEDLPISLKKEKK